MKRLRDRSILKSSSSFSVMVFLLDVESSSSARHIVESSSSLLILGERRVVMKSFVLRQSIQREGQVENKKKAKMRIAENKKRPR